MESASYILYYLYLWSDRKSTPYSGDGGIPDLDSARLASYYFYSVEVLKDETRIMPSSPVPPVGEAANESACGPISMRL